MSRARTRWTGSWCPVPHRPCPGWAAAAALLALLSFWCFLVAGRTSFPFSCPWGARNHFPGFVCHGPKLRVACCPCCRRTRRERWRKSRQRGAGVMPAGKAEQHVAEEGSELRSFNACSPKAALFRQLLLMCSSEDVPVPAPLQHGCIHRASGITCAPASSLLQSSWLISFYFFYLQRV